MSRTAKWRKIPHVPQAVLRTKRNIQQGVSTRTKILKAIEATPKTAKQIAEETGIGYNSILRQLKTMEKEKIVTRDENNPTCWRVTGLGQQPLRKN
ncbi:MAG: winged helix-turn-helix domain-containing protein [Candidatus Freyarchaeota archaeon]|nr:winged helix-turn-helix domain-containing protein [Candidatus Freyrarchaeum guaymaensis]